LIKEAQKRYNAFSAELKRVFGCKVYRISLDAGFTCPNRDGTLGVKGCVFCGETGSGSYGIIRNHDISVQFESAKSLMRRKYKAVKFIAFFQSFTNTYAPIERLQKTFDSILSASDLVGVAIATRPDCLPLETLDYLCSLSKRTYFWLELGLQSIHNKTLAKLNRGHDYASVVRAVEMCKMRELNVCAHVILGLPGETRAEMLETAKEINRLGINGVKIHLLHVLKDSVLAEMYDRGEVTVLDRDAYAGLVCDFLEQLDPSILIHRLTGDGGHDNLVAPLWSLRKFEVLNQIDAELLRRGTFQGSYYSQNL